MERGIWRHVERLPGPLPRARITLGEGMTPLIAAPRLAAAIGIARLYLKLESCNPTGSFKDRDAAYAVSAALDAGVRAIVEDSSGNAGAAAAAYAARAGLACTVFVPASAPAAKLRQAEAYGARIVPVEGPREAASAVARAAARDGTAYHLDHNVNPAFVAGVASLAPELDEPARQGAAIVAPTGGGSIIAGLWQVWSHERYAPPLFAAQSEACAPLVRAFAAGREEVEPVPPQPTIAGGISIGAPPRGRELLHILRASGGGAVAVSEAAIAYWNALLARLEGVYAEPTAAAAVAAVAQLISAGTIADDGTAVAIITGSGLKDPEHAAR
jgi:threonine synthase